VLVKGVRRSLHSKGAQVAIARSRVDIVDIPR
jgi:hypothetical protein